MYCAILMQMIVKQCYLALHVEERPYKMSHDINDRFGKIHRFEKMSLNKL